MHTRHHSYNYVIGWERCNDCRFSGFCDYAKHKEEYLKILKADAKYNEGTSEGTIP